MLGLIKSFMNGYNYGCSLMRPPEHDEDITVTDEISMLEIVIERRKAAAAILEKQLELTSDNNKRITLITKLNTMDKQTLKDTNRIIKLKAML